MKTITVYYGPDHLTAEVADDYTVADLKRDDKFKVGLGWGDNVNALIYGVVQGDGVSVPSGAQVKMETAANKKATV